MKLLNRILNVMQNDDQRLKELPREEKTRNFKEDALFNLIRNSEIKTLKAKAKVMQSWK